MHLAVAPRSEGLTPEDVDAALYDDRAVVKQLAMRRTLFVFPRDLLPAAWGSASARVADSEARRIAKVVDRGGHRPRRGRLARGSSGRHARAAGATARRPWPSCAPTCPSWPAPSAATTDKSYDRPTPVAPWVLTHLGLSGAALRGRNAGHWRLNKPTWSRTEDWLGEVARAARRGRRLRRARPPLARDLRPRHRRRHPVVAGLDEDRRHAGARRPGGPGGRPRRRVLGLGAARRHRRHRPRRALGHAAAHPGPHGHGLEGPRLLPRSRPRALPLRLQRQRRHHGLVGRPDRRLLGAGRPTARYASRCSRTSTPRGARPSTTRPSGSPRGSTAP